MARLSRGGGDHYEAAPLSPLGIQDESKQLQQQQPRKSHTRKQKKKTTRETFLERYEQQKPLSERANPLSRAHLLSVLSAHWIQPLISLGAAKVLELQDLWPVAPEDSCDEVTKRFMLNYRPPQQQAARADEQQQPPKSFSPVISAFFRTFRYDITLVLANFVVFTLALALQAYIAQAILDFLNDRENIFRIGNGYVLVVMMTLASLVAVTCSNHGFHVCSRFGVNVRSVIMDLIYQKSLRLSSEARQAYTTGEIVTLMSVDAERIFNCMTEGFWIVISPFGFIVTIVLIAFLFDFWSALCGAALLVLILYASYCQAKRIGALQARLLRAVDERVKVTSEALQGIRVMKFYAWEDSIARRIQKIREVEVALYRKFHMLQILNIALLFLTPTLLSGVTFGVYVLMHGNRVSVTDAFTLIAMVNVCRAAVGMFPRAIATVSQARIAISRVDAFLASDELRERHDGSEKKKKKSRGPRGTISVRDASFAWSQTAPAAGLVVVSDTSDGESAANKVLVSPVPSTEALNVDTLHFRLEGVNIEIDPGSLVMIVGTVGSGKSSLLSALLGEMILENGSVNIDGDVSYVSQEAWIRNSTVQDNILFEAPFD
ncbi:Abc transporter c family member 2, partial [Globisporangium polare]